MGSAVQLATPTPLHPALGSRPQLQERGALGEQSQARAPMHGGLLGTRSIAAERENSYSL